MGYSFGWWDYVEGERPAMVNSFTGERIVKAGSLANVDASEAIAPYPDTAAGPWTRFEYDHDEFRFPVAVFWQPEIGRIAIDYNLSAKIWRREANDDLLYPPYGGWLRIDDMLPDALWCWPGVIEAYFRRRTPLLERGLSLGEWGSRLSRLVSVISLGGWSNGKWRTELRVEHSLSEDTCSLKDAKYTDVEDTTFGEAPQLRIFSLSCTEVPVTSAVNFYNQEQCAFQSAREFLHPVGTSAPSPWQYHHATKEQLAVHAVQQTPLPDEGFTNENTVPCTISKDGTRALWLHTPHDAWFHVGAGVMSAAYVNAKSGLWAEIELTPKHWSAKLPKGNLLGLPASNDVGMAHFSNLDLPFSLAEKPSKEKLEESDLTKMRKLGYDLDPTRVCTLAAEIYRDLGNAMLVWGDGRYLRSSDQHLQSTSDIVLVPTGFLAGKRLANRCKILSIHRGRKE